MATGIGIAILIGIVVVALIVFSLIVAIFKKFVSYWEKIGKAPVKGLAKVKYLISNRKSIKRDVKLDKALMKADSEARLNSARQNSNYLNNPSVKKIIKKREYKSSKQELKDYKKSI